MQVITNGSAVLSPLPNGLLSQGLIVERDCRPQTGLLAVLVRLSMFQPVQAEPIPVPHFGFGPHAALRMYIEKLVDRKCRKGQAIEFRMLDVRAQQQRTLIFQLTAFIAMNVQILAIGHPNFRWMFDSQVFADSFQLLTPDTGLTRRSCWSPLECGPLEPHACRPVRTARLGKLVG